MKLTMDLGPRSYDIILKAGVLKKAGLLAQLGGRVMVVTDDGVPVKYVKRLMAQCGQPVLVTLPAGEESKTPDASRQIVSRLLEEGFGPQDALAVLGGGMVADVAGFAAAGYMQGIRYYQFPTSTGAQLDALISGFAQLNLDGAKDILGLPFRPNIVVADPDLLKTLPPRHMASGLAEALKIGLLFSRELFEVLEKEDIGVHLEKILYLCLLEKKTLVEQNEQSPAPRRLLRFGHTIGNAIAAGCGLGTLLQGECVALGMLPLIENKTLLRRTRAVMRKLGLPLSFSCTAADVLHWLPYHVDRDGDTYSVARVKTLGRGYLDDVSAEELRLLLQAAFA